MSKISQRRQTLIFTKGLLQFAPRNVVTHSLMESWRLGSPWVYESLRRRYPNYKPKKEIAMKLIFRKRLRSTKRNSIPASKCCRRATRQELAKQK